MIANEVQKIENENRALRQAIKEMEKQFEEEQKKPKACKYCRFYIQHYIRIGGSYSETYCGHCTHGRAKDRKPDNTCDYFELGCYELNHFN